jgi:hypothetical protein
MKMAVVNATKGSGLPYRGAQKVFVIDALVDFDALNVASGDTVEALNVGKGTRVLGTEVEIVRASDAATSASATLGDTENATGFINTIDLKGAVGSITTTPGSYGYARRYTANDTINIVPTYTGAVTIKGAVNVRAICAYMG